MRFKSRFTYILEFIHSYMLLLALMAIPISQQSYADKTFLMVKTLFILAAAVILFFAERKCRSIFSFLLICIPLLIIPYLIRTDTADFVYQELAVILLIVTYIIHRISDNQPWVHAPAIYYELLFLAVYFLGLYLKSPWLCSLMIYLSMGYLLIILLHTNLKNMGDFFRVNKDVSNLPSAQIRLVNRVILLILSVITIAAMILVPLSGLGDGIKALGSMLFGLLKTILRFIFSANDGAEEQPEISTPIKSPFTDQTPAADPSWLTAMWNFLADVFFLLAYVAIPLAIIFFIYKFIRRFYRSGAAEDSRFLTNVSNETDTISSIAPEQRVSHRDDKLGRDPNGIVRRKYKKVILKHASQTPPSNLTPEELETFSGLSKTDEVQMLHRLYEQARYSQNGVTKPEAHSAKNLHIT